MNVNSFGQPMCEPQTVVLRTNSKTAANIRLKEIKKRRALRGNQIPMHRDASNIQCR
jgi:hypothetical protein